MKKNNVNNEAITEKTTFPTENSELEGCNMNIENIGWTLGNYCPFKCSQCYSMSVRKRGKNLDKWMIDLIIDKLVRLGVKTVNLGGNEPLFTNGRDAKSTLLPYIIDKLIERHILVGLTTSGITLVNLHHDHPSSVSLLNDVDISLDSPYENEHNNNRGANLFQTAIKSLKICRELNIDCTIIHCAMSWNFSKLHIDGLVDLARKYGTNIRINTLKPVKRSHLKILPDIFMFYEGFSYLMKNCKQLDVSDPLLASACNLSRGGCPCGRKSFRIHSITPDGRIPISPCVYLHDYKVGNLLEDDIFDLVYSEAFKNFRRRYQHPEFITECGECPFIEVCRGGCAARGYLHTFLNEGKQTLFSKDPYCLKDYLSRVGNKKAEFPNQPVVLDDKLLVHRDYLCTWIGKPL